MLLLGSLVVTSVGFGFVSAAVLALAAVGFTLQFAVTNILNLAYAAVMTVSMYAAYALNNAGVNVWIATPGEFADRDGHRLSRDDADPRVRYPGAGRRHQCVLSHEPGGDGQAGLDRADRRPVRHHRPQPGRDAVRPRTPALFETRQGD